MTRSWLGLLVVLALGVGTLPGTLLLAGCAGPEVAPRSVVSTAELTVVIWSATSQRPVGGRGLLVADADGSTRALDTRNETRGVLLRALPPGRYAIQITHTYEGDRLRPVTGSEVVYLEPGASPTVTVVVTDREDELG